MYKLCFYVPESHLEQVKKALFTTGAGQIGDYAECCWQVLGKGQFKPLEGSRPFIGEPQQLAVVDEWRVELVVVDALITKAVAALKAAHPYETPAYDVWKLADF
ncbi:NGG1p interacting factor NIF3 [Gammaproteobacteria bacterium ESL0073]|nr:NGG1p interacting factor NIF3 [Gammaproteobacteria bacterium ESL0073]